MNGKRVNEFKGRPREDKMFLGDKARVQKATSKGMFLAPRDPGDHPGDLVERLGVAGVGREQRVPGSPIRGLYQSF